MNCDTIQELFSTTFDSRTDSLHNGPLDEDLRRSFDDHLTSCDTCREQYAAFEQSVHRLRRTGVPVTPLTYTDAIMSAVDAERAWSTNPPASRRRTGGVILSHLVTAALGAAAALLIWTIFGFDDARDTPGVRETAGPEHVQPRSLVNVEIDHAALRDAARKIGGSLDRLAATFAAARMPAPAESTQRVAEAMQAEHTIEPAFRLDVMPRIEWASVDWRTAGTAARHMVGAITTIRDYASIGLESLPHSSGLVDIPGRREPIDADDTDFALTVRREGDRVTLETRGQLVEVIPALISRLHDPDPAIVDVVRRRLEEIRQDLAADPGFKERRAPAQTAGNAESQSSGPFAAMSNLLLPAFGSGDAEPPDAANDPEDWSAHWWAWWNRNAVSVLELETVGTL